MRSRQVEGRVEDVTGEGPPSSADLWLGTVAFGRWGNADGADSERIIQRALDHGFSALDTAASYAEGDSEEIVGRAVKGRRDQVFITTKYGYDNATAGTATLSAQAMRDSLDASLRRLRTDYVDVFFLHRVPAGADRSELAAGLDSLVRAGKARAVGTSMTAPADLVDLQSLASEKNLARPTWEQPPHSLFVRHIEDDILATCVQLGVQVSTFAPLNGGWLTGKYQQGVAAPAGSRATSWPIRRDRFDVARPEGARKLELVQALSALAAESGRTLGQLAMDFTRSHRGVTAVIVGARSQEQLDELLGLEHRPLEPDLLAAIDHVVPPGTTVDAADILGYRT